MRSHSAAHTCSRSRVTQLPLTMHCPVQHSFRSVPRFTGSCAAYNRPDVCRSHTHRLRGIQACKTDDQGPLQPMKSVVASLAAAALLISPLAVPVAPAAAAGSEVQLDQQGGVGLGDSNAEAKSAPLTMMAAQEAPSLSDPQPSKNPGWPTPSPMPHPPADPPQTPSPDAPHKHSLPPGPPDLLPRKPPAPDPQPTPQPELPPLPDVPPQLLPPCNPNPDPPQLLPPCPQAPPPIRPLEGSVSKSRADSAAAAVSGRNGSDVVGTRSVRTGAMASGDVAAAAVGPKSALHLTDTALLTASPVEGAPGADAPLDAAFDAVLTPTAGGAVPAAAATTTLDKSQSVTPSGKLDSSNMSVNLDGKGLTTSKGSASTSKATAPTSKDSSKASSKDSGSKGSKGSSSTGTGVGNTAGTAGALNAFADWQPGSITLEQVGTEAGKLALQLLEVVVRIGVFLIKYSLKAFIWLVKAIAQYVSASN